VFNESLDDLVGEILLLWDQGTDTDVESSSLGMVLVIWTSTDP
jgi:hypothetical protein